MSTFKDKGIVIREYTSGEYDKNIVLLLKERGKVNVFVKGAKNPKSKYFAGTQLFSYCEFVIFEGRGFLSVTQMQIIDSFYGISVDYEKFCQASYYVELISSMILESMQSEKALYLLIKSLSALSKDLMNNLLISSIFELKLMQMEGYSPQLGECVSCGDYCEPESDGELFFSYQGIICKNCVHKEEKVLKINEKVIFVMRYILDNDIKELFKINVTLEVVEKLKQSSHFFVENNIDINLKSSNYLE